MFFDDSAVRSKYDKRKKIKFLIINTHIKIIIYFFGFFAENPYEREKRITAARRDARDVFSIHYLENKNFISPEISFLNLIIHI